MANTLKQSDPMATMLASLKPADLSVFNVKAGRPKVPNPWVPFVRRSVEGKNAEGQGAAFQIPRTYGENVETSRLMRAAARDLGYSLQARWTATDAEAWTLAEKLFNSTPADDVKADGYIDPRDAVPGVLAFRTVPQITRERKPK